MVGELSSECGKIKKNRKAEAETISSIYMVTFCFTLSMFSRLAVENHGNKILGFENHSSAFHMLCNACNRVLGLV
ncbi:hypothetical protein Fmac_022752 [Flemingia macrophylla]|uniref:Yippee domain-containing protein n=1 Tax=Flemingia macrophylla TaxID=520843 RepID=A0ABD1M0L3_9FABA